VFCIVKAAKGDFMFDGSEFVRCEFDVYLRDGDIQCLSAPAPLVAEADPNLVAMPTPVSPAISEAWFSIVLTLPTCRTPRCCSEPDHQDHISRLFLLAIPL